MDEGAYQAIVQSIVKGQTRHTWGSQGKNAEVVPMKIPFSKDSWKMI